MIYNFSFPPVNTISKQQFSEVSLQDRYCLSTMETTWNNPATKKQVARITADPFLPSNFLSEKALFP